ncbi:hypothetical protein B5S29_g3129 [[Candida] boidinii]|nr:hypothetical protein B5S29_g3129 [[Candida] boidinii]
MNVIDRRRNLGPSQVQPLLFATKSLKDDLNNTTNNTKDPQVVPNTDKDNQILKNKKYIKTGLLLGSNGSSYIEINNNIVESSIYGPRPILSRQLGFKNQAELKIHVKFSPFTNIENLSTDIKILNESNKHKIFDNNTSSTMVGLTAQKVSNYTDSNKLITSNLISSSNNSNNSKQLIENRISEFLSTIFSKIIILKNYPKSNLEIYCNIIKLNVNNSNNENWLIDLISQLIDSISLSIIDSGIEIKDFVTSGQKGNIVCGVISNGDDDEIVGIWCDDENNQQDLVNDIDECIKIANNSKKEYSTYLLSLLK